jgi:hypothetical protein
LCREKGEQVSSKAEIAPVRAKRKMTEQVLNNNCLKVAGIGPLTRSPQQT